MTARAQRHPAPVEDLRGELERHHGDAFAWARTCCDGDRSVAEDVLQTSYLKILDGRARFRGESAFRTWLFSVIRHTAVDAWRSAWRARRRPLHEVERDLVWVQPVDHDTERPDLRRVARAFAELPRRQAEVLSLVYGHGMTLREAAAVLGVAQGSAAQHLHRGKHRLRKRLGVR